MDNFLTSKAPAFQELIKTAPLNPGCYIYKNPTGKILYVGKAKVIRNRVKSYFINYARLDPKIQIMLEQATSIEFVITDSEMEALIIESNLIKKLKPKYNTMLMDDKNYIWIRIDRAGKDGVTIPTLVTLRQKLDDHAYYYGPYPNTAAVRRTIDKLRRIFPFCTDGKKYQRSDSGPIRISGKAKKPCFHYHLGQCKGICAGMEDLTDYKKRILAIRKFLEGKKGELLAELEVAMKLAAKNQHFEKAALLRDRLEDLRYVTRYITIDKDLDEVGIMQEKTNQKQQALTNLVTHLSFPEMRVHAGFRIECYDISNIQGTNAVGAMTVLIDGKPEPKLYRKFRIRMKNEPNDFAMMQEVLFRRFYSLLLTSGKQADLDLTDSEGNTIDVKKHYTAAARKLDESFTQIPDLIVIDGGKGQLSSAFHVMQKFNLNIPMVGLAKREEEIFLVKQQRIALELIDDSCANQQELEFGKIHLSKRDPALHLLQNVRDEAHRFGITYHRKLRLKQTLV